MKSRRHDKILELISECNIDTQEELQERLNQEGFRVTQATVSRDIKELRLIKRWEQTEATVIQRTEKREEKQTFLLNFTLFFPKQSIGWTMRKIWLL